MTAPETRPLRILHVFQKMDRGGAEMRTLDVMRTIDREQFTLDFCALSGQAGSLDKEIAQLGGRTHLSRLGLLFPIRFIRLLRKERYDVVHSHVLLVSGFILLLARLAGVPGRIAHFRSTGNGQAISNVRQIRDRILRFLIDRTATDILAVSHGAMKAVWTSYQPEDARCRVVYNGVDTRAYENTGERSRMRADLDVSEECIVFIHVGRFDKAKNHERLIEIFARVRQLAPASILLLVGGGESSREDKIRSRVAELGLRESVRFLGIRDDVPALLMAADVMIFPSRWEGLPGAVLEAAAAGLPVVATDLPGVSEIAGQLEDIDTLDLDRDDGVWAEQAVCAAALGRDRSSRGNSLSGSPFDLKTNREALESIWSSAGI